MLLVAVVVYRKKIAWKTSAKSGGNIERQRGAPGVQCVQDRPMSAGFGRNGGREPNPAVTVKRRRPARPKSASAATFRGINGQTSALLLWKEEGVDASYSHLLLHTYLFFFFFCGGGGKPAPCHYCDVLENCDNTVNTTTTLVTNRQHDNNTANNGCKKTQYEMKSCEKNETWRIFFIFLRQKKFSENQHIR